MDNFKAAWWLPGPHAQTIWSRFFRHDFNLSIRRERFDLPDGDFVDLDWNTKGTGPIVLILHGLGGSIDSHYAKGLLTEIEAAGWRGVLMHFRGCSGVSNRLPRSYHAGETQDLSEILAILRAREPDVPFAVVGYSLGGNVVLKWLGQSAKDEVKAAAAISVPFDLNLSCERIQQGFSKIYQWYLLRELKATVRKKAERLKPFINVKEALKAKTIKDFDRLVTAPLHGFNTVDEYYQNSSSRQYLNKIQTPTLILHAKDDPFVGHQAIPAPSELSSSIQFRLSESGGHVGFVSGHLTQPEYWIEKQVVKYLRPFLCG